MVTFYINNLISKVILLQFNEDSWKMIPEEVRMEYLLNQIKDVDIHQELIMSETSKPGE